MFNLRVILRDWLNKQTPEEMDRSKAIMDALARQSSESFERLRRRTEQWDDWRKAIAASSGLIKLDGGLTCPVLHSVPTLLEPVGECRKLIAHCLSPVSRAGGAAEGMGSRARSRTP